MFMILSSYQKDNVIMWRISAYLIDEETFSITKITPYKLFVFLPILLFRIFFSSFELESDFILDFFRSF